MINQLLGLSDQPKQQTTIILADGTQATLYMEYVPAQLGWSFSLTYGSKVINGQRIVSSPNLLRHWKNVLPFGLAVITDGNAEPTTQTAFKDGTTLIYLLDAADVKTIEAAVFVRPFDNTTSAGHIVI